MATISFIVPEDVLHSVEHFDNVSVRVEEPDLDAAVRTRDGATLDPDTVFLGEIGLNGEIRRVPQVERRLSEAARHGFRTAIIPRNSVGRLSDPPAINIVGVDNLRGAMAECGLMRRGSSHASGQEAVGVLSVAEEESR